MNKTLDMLKTFIDVFFPRDPRSILCDTLSQNTLEKLSVKTHTHVLEDCIAPLPYRHTLVHSAIWTLKYDNHERAAVILASAIAPFVAEEISERQMFGNFYTPLLTAVPLHKEKKKERGYNQSERIALALLHTLGKATEVDFTVLTRIKKTPPQAQSVDKQARFKNMHRAFTVTRPDVVQGRDVILVDDVVTTGATLSEARRVLFEAGASSVLCIAVAH